MLGLVWFNSLEVFSAPKAYHAIVENARHRRSLIDDIVDNVIIGQNSDIAVALAFSILFSNDPNIGLFGAIGSVERDIFLQGIMFHDILEASLMTQVGLEFGPRTENVVLAGRAGPLCD